MSWKSIELEVDLEKIAPEHRFDVENVLLGMRHSEWELPIAERYLKAIIANDTETISEMQKACKWDDFRVGVMLENLGKFEAAKRFGFEDYTENKNGWYWEEWPYEENVELRVKGDKAFCANYINLKRGPNGKWAYGVNRGYGIAGGGYRASVFGPVLNTREEALVLGLLELQKDQQEAVKKKDSANYKPAYIKLVLAKIDEMLEQLKQSKATTKEKEFFGLRGCKCHPYKTLQELKKAEKQKFELSDRVLHRCNGKKGTIIEIIGDFFWLVRFDDRHPTGELVHSTNLHFIEKGAFKNESRDIEPGLYVSTKKYLNSFGKMTAVGERIYVYDWFKEEGFCICSIVLNGDRFHMVADCIVDNFQRVDSLPITVERQEVVTVSVENKNADSKPFLLVPAEIAEEAKPIIETVDGLQKIALFEKQEIKAPKKRVGYYGYIGKDKTDNQRFKRKLDGMVRKIKELPAAERSAILLAISELKIYYPPPQISENEPAAINP